MHAGQKKIFSMILKKIVLKKFYFLKKFSKKNLPVTKSYILKIILKRKILIEKKIIP